MFLIYCIISILLTIMFSIKIVQSEKFKWLVAIVPFIIPTVIIYFFGDLLFSDILAEDAQAGVLVIIIGFFTVIFSYIAAVVVYYIYNK